MSVMALIAGFAMCAISLFLGFRGETFMGRHLGGDFVEFYAAGKIQNQFDAARIYDLELITRTEHGCVPEMDQSQMLIYGNAPYIALLFRPLSRLPYRWAYCVWLVFSMGLYLAGLRILLADLQPGEARTAFLLALSCAIFIFETWIGGQLSVFAFLAIVLFFRGLHRGRLFLAGVALGCAAYKPSLLVIPIAMLVVTGGWRVLGGVMTSGAAAGLVSFAMIGWSGMLRWMAALKFFGNLAVGPHSIMRRTKYVDFNSFFHMLFGNGSVIAGVCAGLAAAGAFAMLVSLWWTLRGAKNVHGLLWAATFVLTLVINVYVPVYDALILVPALVLVFRSMHSGVERSTFGAWLTALYLASWLSQAFAEMMRVQILTLLIAGFGVWILTIVRNRRQACEAEDSLLVAGKVA